MLLKHAWLCQLSSPGGSSGPSSLVSDTRYSTRSIATPPPAASSPSKRIPKRFIRRAPVSGHDEAAFRCSWHGSSAGAAKAAAAAAARSGSRFMYSGNVVRPTEVLNEAKGRVYIQSTFFLWRNCHATVDTVVHYSGSRISIFFLRIRTFTYLGIVHAKHAHSASLPKWLVQQN